MLIALLAVLGVDLIVVVALLALVLSRKRWVKRRPGAFHGAIRVTGGAIDGLGPKWHRGYGHWVRDVFVWTKAPMLFRNALIPIDGADEPQAARPGEVKRLGDHPVVVRVRTGGATAEIAVRGDDSELARGPRNTPEAVVAST
ncbi:DUF2550 family protein [Solirubrobacter ginsenosidimutans]|uniref:DUF2550 family protein n=1 Tax=Solirubrobacter ginsenosidimutans TaxID=490573 RepID=A0A9X3N2F8_9ACTN|nr:DUF2550 family protein [Solirubrobacter ginsenosidimutans]MDA0167274.1 DUF2550 family protein [Solirubrobacter ginsenosidimutans]